MSLRDAVCAATGQRTIDDSYTCPVLGKIRLQSLFEDEWQDGVLLWFVDANWKRIPERKKYDNVKLLQMCLVGDDNNRVFTDSLEDLDRLLGLPTAIVKPIYELALKMNRPEPIKNG